MLYLFNIYQEQYYINCGAEPNMNCLDAGIPTHTLYFLNINGTTRAKDVPYTAVQSSTSCPTKKPVYKLPNDRYMEYYSEYESSILGTMVEPSPNGNCTRLRQLLTHGPVISKINADEAFNVYKSGAYSSTTWYVFVLLFQILLLRCF